MFLIVLRTVYTTIAQGETCRKQKYKISREVRCTILWHLTVGMTLLIKTKRNDLPDGHDDYLYVID